jgi:hypothetical protein
MARASVFSKAGLQGLRVLRWSAQCARGPVLATRYMRLANRGLPEVLPAS